MLGRGSKPERCSGWIALLISPVLLSTHAANGATTSYHYNGLTASVTGGGEDGDARRLLSWQQQDQLGRTTLLRSYTPGEEDWMIEAEISLAYDIYSRLNSESVSIDSLTRTNSYGYDNYHRPTTVTYHGGEVVATSYGSPGAAVGLSSSVHGRLVDRVSFDGAGRMTALRLPAAGNLWRTQRYYPWTAKRNGGMLESLKVGLSEGGGERLNRSYAYNYFGDITALTEEMTSHSFTYDGLGRLTAASDSTSSYSRTYSYDGANRLTAFNGQSYGYGDGGPYHAVDRIGGDDRFDYDANGNMTVRNKGLAGQQTLVWDAQNRLSLVQDNNYGSLPYENGAEGVTVWVYNSYRPRPRYNTITPIKLTDSQKSDIRRILLP